MENNVWFEIVDGRLDSPLPAVTGTNTKALRPWPPVMLRDFIRANDSRNGTMAADVSPDITIGDVADFLASSPGAVVAVVGHDNYLLGVAVDSDVMALIKRDGVKALDYPISEALQCGRPVCSATDSPYVVAALMRDRDWDRVGVADHGRVIGIVSRRDLIDYFDA